MKKLIIVITLLLLVFPACSDNNEKSSPPPDPYLTNLDAGKEALENGDFETAADYFEKAISIDSKDYRAHYGRLLSYSGLVVEQLGEILKIVQSMSAPSVFVAENFQTQGFDLKEMFKGPLDLLEKYLNVVVEESSILESYEWVNFYVEHLPLHFDTSALLGEDLQEKLGDTSYVDLGGEWGLIELYWIGGTARFLLGVLDLIAAHDLDIQNIPPLNFDNGIEVFIVQLLLDNPNFLGPDPDPQEASKLFNVGDWWGDAFLQWSELTDAGTVELQHDPDQSNNVVPIYDVNKNGVYDPGDGIGLYKLLPVGINPDIANLFGQVYFSESMGQKVADTLFDDWDTFLRNVGLSLKGTLGRRLTMKDDVNPLLEDLNEKPIANILELDLHALFDDVDTKYLRDLLPYIYYDDRYKNAYVFVIEHNDPYMTREEIVDYARTQTEFAGKVTYGTASTDPIWHNVFCLVDQPHFDVDNNPSYADVEGLEKIPADCLIDVNQEIIHITYPEDTTVPDHPSLTYIAFKDPTFSGLGCINLDEWPVPYDFFTGIPNPYVPPELAGKGCQPPTQYSLNALFQYFILYFEGQEVEIFGFNLNRLFSGYSSVFSFSPMRKRWFHR